MSDLKIVGNVIERFFECDCLEIICVVREILEGNLWGVVVIFILE